MPRSAMARIAILRTRAFAVGAVLAVWGCGAVGLWAVFDESVQEPDIFYVVGVAAGLAFVAAALALVRRSWARVPLLGVCLIASGLVQDSLFSEQDPSEMYIVGYFVLIIFMMLLAGVALLIAAFAAGAASPLTND